MARQKKDSVALNLNIETRISEKLSCFCESVGLTKTKVIEKAVEKYIDDYYALHPEEYIENTKM